MSDDFFHRRSDDFYIKRGVEPPERISHGIHDNPEELEKLMKKNLEGHVCKWYQRGNEISCEEGEFTHGKRIDPKLRLKTPGGPTPELIPFVIQPR